MSGKDSETGKKNKREEDTKNLESLLKTRTNRLGEIISSKRTDRLESRLTWERRIGELLSEKREDASLLRSRRGFEESWGGGRERRVLS